MQLIALILHVARDIAKCTVHYVLFMVVVVDGILVIFIPEGKCHIGVLLLLDSSLALLLRDKTKND